MAGNSTKDKIEALVESLKKFGELGNINIPDKLADSIKKLNEAVKSINSGDAKKIDTLVQSLKKLGTVGSIHVPTTLISSINNVNNTIKGLDVNNTRRVDKLVESLRKLNELNNISISADLSKSIRDLNNAVKSLDGKNENKLNSLVQGLEKLKTVSNISVSSSLISSIDSINSAVKNIDANATRKVEKLVDSLKRLGELKNVSFPTNLITGLNKLKNLGSINISDTLARQIREISEAASAIQFSDGGKLESLADGLKTLSDVPKINIPANLGNSLRSITQAVNEMPEDSVKRIEKLSGALHKLSDSISNLGSNNVTNLNALATGLKAIKPVANMTISPSIAKQVKAISKASEKMNTTSGTNLSNLAEGLTALKGVGSISLSETIPKRIQEISNAVKGISGSSASKLSSLASGLTALSAVPRVSIPANIATQITKLSEAINRIPANSSRQLKQFTAALQSLRGLSDIRIPNNIGTQLNRITIAARVATPDDINKLKEIANALKSFNGISNVRLTSFVNSLKKLMDLLLSMDRDTFARFIIRLRQVADALRPVTQGINNLNTSFRALNNNMGQSNNTLKKFGSMFLGLFSAQQIGRLIASAIEKSNKYQEDLNLFTVAMGEYAEQAKEYANTVSDALGIDPAAWMRDQGIFNTVLTGFGATADRAALMSKNLTQLGYDLSSFFNLPVQETMYKIQSGISGELEPLRRLGYDLSVARLQQTADELGIKKRITLMTQAEKAELRYYAIMTQVTEAQGDMARTLNSPANQIRVLKAQIDQLVRAIGDVFIPWLNQLLPWLTAVAMGLKEIVKEVARLNGFEITDVDYSGVNTGVAGVNEELEEADENVKKIKRNLLGFDELNIFEDSEDTALDDLAGGFNYDLPDYDMLKGAVESQAKEIYEKNIKPIVDWIKEHLSEILDIVTKIGIAFLTWKIGSTIFNAIDGISRALNSVLGEASGFKGKLLRALGLTGLAIGIPIYLEGLGGAFESGGHGFTDWEDVAKATGGGLLSGLSAAALGGSIGRTAKDKLKNAGIAGEIATLLEGIPAIGEAMKGLMHDGFSAENLATIGAFTAEAAAFGFMIGGPVGALIGGGTALVGGFVYALLGDAIPAIDLFANTTEETAQRLEPVHTKIMELQNSFSELKFNGTIIDDNVIADTKQKAEQVVSTLINSLNEERNRKLANLTPSLFGSEEEYNAEIAKINEKYDTMIDDIKNNYGRIVEIMENAKAEGRTVTQAEYDEILGIMKTYDEQAISELSATEADKKYLLENSGQDRTRKQLEIARETLKNAMNERDNEVQVAKDKYDKLLEQYDRQYEAGEITKEQYEQLVAQAKQNRDDEIQIAWDKYRGIADATREGLGEYANEINYWTGEIKTDWDHFWEGISDWLNETVQGIGEAFNEFGRQVGNFLNPAQAAIKEFEKKHGTFAKRTIDRFKAINDEVSKHGAVLATSVAGSLGIIKDEVDSKTSYISDKVYQANKVIKTDTEATALAVESSVKYQNGLIQTNVENTGTAVQNSWLGTKASVVQSSTDMNTESSTQVGYLKNSVETAFQSMSDKIGTTTGSSATFMENMKTRFQTAWQQAKESGQTFIEDIGNQIVESLNKIDSFMGSAFEKAQEKLREQIDRAEQVARNSYSAGYQLGASGVPKIKTTDNATLKGYASGGYPKRGDLYIANEDGSSEMIGKMGNNPAVANNDQIVEGIKQGVYEANMESYNTHDTAYSSLADITKTVNTVKTIGSEMKKEISRSNDKTYSALEGATKTALEETRKTISTIELTANNIGNEILNTVKTIDNAIKEKISEIDNAIRFTLDGILNTVLDGISRIIETIKATTATVGEESSYMVSPESVRNYNPSTVIYGQTGGYHAEPPTMYNSADGNAYDTSDVAGTIIKSTEAQNVILREQNDLLRQLISKAGIISLDGKKISNNQNARARMYGKSVVTV